MSMKILAAALLASALVSAQALAQSSPPASSSPGAANTNVQASETVQKSGTWRASKLIGLNVYNNNNEKIGDISELITDQSGKIDLVVIGAGGFLGMGTHNVAVPFSQIKWMDQPRQATTGAADRPAAGGAAAPAARPATTASGPRDYPDHAVLNTSKDQLKAMPAFKYASDARSTTSGNTGGSAGTPPARTPPAGTPPAQQR